MSNSYEPTMEIFTKITKAQNLSTFVKHGGWHAGDSYLKVDT